MNEPVDVKSLWQRSVNHVSDQIRNYRLNVAFYRNMQSVEWNPLKQDVDVLIDDRRPPSHVNLIRSRVNRLVAKVVSNRLEFYCMPSAGDDSSRGRAINSQRLLQWRVQVGGWDALRAQNALAFILGGTSLIIVEPDPDGIEKLGVFAVDEAVLEPYTRSPQEARWCLVCTAAPAESVQAAYGLPEPPTGAGAAAALGPRLTGMANIGSAPGVRLVPVYRYYEKPNKLRPRGLMLHSTGTQTLWESDWLFPTEDLNAFLFRQTQLHGTWIGDTCVSDARSVQVQYNDLRRSILEHVDVHRTRLLIPIGSVDVDDVTNDPRDPIEYIPGAGEPKYLSAPSVSSALFNQPEMLVQEIDEQMYTHEASRGVAPGDRYSGTAIAALNEYNNGPLISMLREERESWAQIGQFVLRLYAAQPPSREWKATMDANGITSEYAWTPLLLDGDARVSVRADSDVPQSPVVLQARLAELASQFPQLAQMIDVSRLLRLLNIPGADSITSAQDADVRLAQWENLQMFAGQVIMPRPFENHATHIAEHNWMRKQPEFHTWPEETQRLMDDHIQAHQRLEELQMMQQALLNDVAPGLGGMPQADEPTGSAVPSPRGQITK